MNLDNISLDVLLSSAIKSEIESRKAYQALASGVKNIFLKEKLKFLAQEELHHKIVIEDIFKKNFPDKTPDENIENPLPMPEIKIYDGNMPVSEVMESAIEAEKAAYQFYLSLAERFSGDESVKRALTYLAIMELGHFRSFQVELDALENDEYYDMEWPMMNIGP